MKYSSSSGWTALYASLFLLVCASASYIFFADDSVVPTWTPVAVAPVPVEEPVWPSAFDDPKSSWKREVATCSPRAGVRIDVAEYAGRIEVYMYMIRVIKMNDVTIAYRVRHQVHDGPEQRVSIVRNTFQNNWLRYDESHAPDPEPSYLRFIEEIGVTDVEMGVCKERR